MRVIFRRDQKPHRNHRRFVEAVPAEEFLRLIFRSVGEEGDAEKILLPGELDRMFKQERAIAVTLILFMNDKVLEQTDKTAFRGTDGKKQIDHADDDAVAAQNEHAAAARLFENQSQRSEERRVGEE